MIKWEELVEQASNKNEEAITQLYVHTIKKSTIFIRQFIKDDDLAQDILQESYMKAFNNLNSLQTPEKFQAWLNRIIKNSCMDYFKKKKPILFSELGTEEDAFEEFEIEDTRIEFRPEESMDKKETARLIQEMLDNLPEAQRIVLTLRYMEGYSVTEVANELGISEGTVKSRSFKAKSNMERQIEALSKKGIKLRGISIVALLYWLYGQGLTTYAKGVVSSAASASIGTGVTSAGASIAAQVVTGSSTVGQAAAVNIGGSSAKVALKHITADTVQKTAVAQSVNSAGNAVKGVAQTINPVGNGMQGMAQTMNPVGSGMQGMAQTINPVGNGMQGMAQTMNPVGNGMQGMAQTINPVGNGMQGMAQTMNPVGNGMQGIASAGMQGAGNAGMQMATSAGMKGAKKAAAFGLGKMMAVAVTTAVVGVGGYQVYQSVSSTPEKTIEKLEDACNDLDYDAMVECFDPQLETMLSAVEMIGSNVLGMDVAFSDIFDMVGIGIDYIETNEYGEIPEIDIEVIDQEEIGTDHIEVEIQITEESTQVTITDYLEMKKFDNEWRILID